MKTPNTPFSADASVSMAVRVPRSWKRRLSTLSMRDTLRLGKDVTEADLHRKALEQYLARREGAAAARANKHRAKKQKPHGKERSKHEKGQ